MELSSNIELVGEIYEGKDCQCHSKGIRNPSLGSRYSIAWNAPNTPNNMVNKNLLSGEILLAG